MGDKSFCKPLGLEGHKRLRFRIKTRQGRVRELTVQLKILVDGAWKPVVRYDNTHDFPHRDVMNLRGHEVEKTILHLGALEEVLEYARI